MPLGGTPFHQVADLGEPRRLLPLSLAIGSSSLATRNLARLSDSVWLYPVGVAPTPGLSHNK